jgi:hypothetical protein
MGKDLERGSHGLFDSRSSLRGWRKSRGASFRRAGNPEIRKRYFPNTSLERYRYINLLELPRLSSILFFEVCQEHEIAYSISSGSLYPEPCTSTLTVTRPVVLVEPLILIYQILLKCVLYICNVCVRLFRILQKTTFHSVHLRSTNFRHYLCLFGVLNLRALSIRQLQLVYLFLGYLATLIQFHKFYIVEWNGKMAMEGEWVGKEAELASS